MNDEGIEKELEDGYYWVKFNSDQWIIAEYFFHEWYLTGRDRTFTNDEFREINRLKIDPPKQ